MGGCRELADAIEAAAAEVVAGQHDDQFPLTIWQTGSGTQSNMNVNEVIAGRANEMLTGARGGKSPVHPNDHVQYEPVVERQFSDGNAYRCGCVATPTACNPQSSDLSTVSSDKVEAWNAIIKIGRTHLQDATPLTLGQEFSGYVSAVDRCQVSHLGLHGTTVATCSRRHGGWYRPERTRKL